MALSESSNRTATVAFRELTAPHLLWHNRAGGAFDGTHVMALIRLLTLVLFASFWFTAAQAADEGARVILVLDASGSMRGKIDGKSKMDIAKAVVGRIVKSWNPADELGLVVYGHRKKGSCDDIEVLREPGALDAAQYMKSVNGLNPKGKTPMTQAVRMAAESLQYTEKKATVILVSDGIETCDADPCAVAEELAKAGVELKVHTVGFGLDDQGAVAQLRCLAEKTGGTFTTANNEADLQKALAKTVKAEAPPPIPAPAPAEKFNFRGHVRQAGGLELAKPFGGANWVFKTAPQADGTEGAYVSTEYEPEMKTNLAPGKYVVTITSDYATVDVPFEIKAGEVTKIDTSLNAGIVKLSGEVAAGSPVGEAANWVIADPDGKYLATLYGAHPQALLKSGDYKVKLTLGNAKADAAFHVDAGKTSDQLVSLGAGKLLVSAVFSKGGEAMSQGMAFEVRHPDTATGDKGEWIATDYAAQSKFDLPAGKYVVIVKLGLAEAHQDVEVTAGAPVTINIDANAGFIAATADGVTSFEVREGKKSLDGDNKWITTSYDPTLNIAANAGSYLVKAFRGDEVIGEKVVDVKAGERSEITLP
jgi:Ca-activated chloride channel homolog